MVTTEYPHGSLPTSTTKRFQSAEYIRRTRRVLITDHHLEVLRVVSFPLCFVLFRSVSLGLVWFGLVRFGLVWFGLVPFCLVPFCFVPFCSVPFHSIPFRSIPFHVPFSSMPFRFVSFRFVSFRFVSFRSVSFRFILFRPVPFRFVCLVPFRSVPFRFVSFRFVPFRFSLACPAMSQSCSLTVVSPTDSCFSAKSTPTVVLWCPEKKSCTYLPTSIIPFTQVHRSETVDNRG